MDIWPEAKVIPGSHTPGPKRPVRTRIHYYARGQFFEEPLGQRDGPGGFPALCPNGILEI